MRDLNLVAGYIGANGSPHSRKASFPGHLCLRNGEFFGREGGGMGGGIGARKDAFVE